MKRRKMNTFRKKDVRTHSIDGRLEINIGEELKKSLDKISQKERVSLSALGRLAVSGLIEFYQQSGDFWTDVRNFERRPGRPRRYNKTIQEILAEMT